MRTGPLRIRKWGMQHEEEGLKNLSLVGSSSESIYIRLIELLHHQVNKLSQFSFQLLHLSSTREIRE